LMSLESPLFECRARSIEMENLFHLRRPLALFSGRQRFLHRLHDRPPLLSFGMRSHLDPVTFQVASVVFEIAEEHAVLEVDGIVLDVAFQNLVQDLRPNRRVVSLVIFLSSWLEPDHHSKALHCSHPWARSSAGFEDLGPFRSLHAFFKCLKFPSQKLIPK